MTNQLITNQLPIDYSLISLMSLMSSISYAWIITAPSEYVSNVVHLPLIADIPNNALQKQWSSSEFLNCYAHVST